MVKSKLHRIVLNGKITDITYHIDSMDKIMQDHIDKRRMFYGLQKKAKEDAELFMINNNIYCLNTMIRGIDSIILQLKSSKSQYERILTHDEEIII